MGKERERIAIVWVAKQFKNSQRKSMKNILVDNSRSDISEFCSTHYVCKWKHPWKTFDGVEIQGAGRKHAPTASDFAPIPIRLNVL